MFSFQLARAINVVTKLSLSVHGYITIFMLCVQDFEVLMTVQDPAAAYMSGFCEKTSVSVFSRSGRVKVNQGGVTVNVGGD